MRLSLPFFVMTFLGLVLFKVDTLMLFLIKSSSTVAIYEAAYKPLEASRFIIRPAAMIFFPACCSMAACNAWLQFRSVYRRLLLVAGLLGMIVTLGMLITAGFIIPVAWGPQYEESIPILRVLSLAVPAVYLGFVAAFLANALHAEKKAIRIMLVCVSVNVILNSITIPLWGSLGAAWTTVISESLLAIWLIQLIIHTLKGLPAEDAESSLPIGRLQPSLVPNENQ
jgi:O-antigen/teichoic acid export membrane protein